MRIGFELTDEDYLDYLAHLTRTHPRHLAAISESRKREAQWVSLLAALFVLQLIVCVGGRVFERGGLPMLAGACELFVTGLVAVRLLGDWARGVEGKAGQYDRMYRAMVKRGDMQKDWGWQEVGLSATCIRAEAEHWSARSDWMPQILEVIETPTVIAMEIRNGSAYLIPKRAFAQPDDARAFAETARQFHRLAWADEIQRLREYLANRDLRCGACKYSLRGLASNRCPECGAAIPIPRYETSAPQPDET